METATLSLFIKQVFPVWSNNTCVAVEYLCVPAFAHSSGVRAYLAQSAGRTSGMPCCSGELASGTSELTELQLKRVLQRIRNAIELYLIFICLPSFMLFCQLPNGLRPRSGPKGVRLPRLRGPEWDTRWWAGLGTIPALSRDETTPL